VFSIACARKGAFVSALCAAIALGGCSSGSVAPVSSSAGASVRTAHGWLSPAAKHKKLVYISDHTASAVYIFSQDANPQQLGQITDGLDGPEGLTVDTNGTLYVANQRGDSVTEYAAGTTTPKVTITDSIVDPSSVVCALRIGMRDRFLTG
jgi:hypothetical protein